MGHWHKRTIPSEEKALALLGTGGGVTVMGGIEKAALEHKQHHDEMVMALPP
jgi:hypothetical protein